MIKQQKLGSLYLASLKKHGKKQSFNLCSREPSNNYTEGDKDWLERLGPPFCALRKGGGKLFFHHGYLYWYTRL